ncbi:MAG: PQQ-dependent sugar dehydrogenase [Ktedonobacteraceae bacterium]|nr:PQQ-dependent sugar dehydrogenase [Ktedonobacteraceae bacterium]
MRRLGYILLSLCLLLAVYGCSPAGSTNTYSVQSNKSQGNGLTATPGSGPLSSITRLHLPPGFKVSVYATGLKIPRFITLGPQGVLLVAERGANRVVAIPPGDSALHGGQPIVIADHLDSPTSVIMHDGYLYVGEGAAVSRIALGDDLKAGPVQRIITGLPERGQHYTRTVLIGPDNHIYVSIGSDCNVCRETNPYRATIWVFNMDGTHGRMYARGLRNAVGLAVNPWTRRIWIDVNGRDQMGDNLPPETVYQLVDQGDYGWPRCHAGTIHDPQFGHAANACQGVQVPLVKMQAHSAPLGMAFYPPGAAQFPVSYRSSLYIAFHGSWNRSIPTGYKVVRIPLQNGKVAGPPQDFISGWLNSNGTSWGRPVGIAFAADGSMFVSDDASGTIYHVWYHG